MSEFVLVYSMAKVIRIMAAGTIFMAAALLVCRLAGSRRWRLKLGALCLAPLACLTAYSKLFYMGKIAWFTGFTAQIISKEMAAWYFGIAAILALRFYWMGRELRLNLRRMRRMDVAEVSDALLQGRGPEIQVYLSDCDDSGPFAGGILKPYIVIPENLKNRLSKEELSAILRHEALHIRLGHIILLYIYAALKILWWAHPLIYVCDRAVRENIEYSSDEGSLAMGALSAYAYGSVMLKTLQRKRRSHATPAGITTFTEDNYLAIKRRIEKLSDWHSGDSALYEYQRKKRRLHTAAGTALVVGAVALLLTCYPRYTKLKEIAVYDDKLKPITFDLASDGIHAKISDGNFYISNQEFQKLVSKYRLKGEYIVFSYDVIMKVPGVGGGGQAAMVNMEDPTDVFLLGKYTWEDHLKVFIMKYFL